MLFIYMHERGRLQLETQLITSGLRHSYPELAWLVKQGGLYIATLYTVWGLKTYFPKQTVSDTADILCHNFIVFCQGKFNSWVAVDFTLYIFQGQELGYFWGSETLSSYTTMSILILLFEPASNLSLLYPSSSLNPRVST